MCESWSNLDTDPNQAEFLVQIVQLPRSCPPILLNVFFLIFQQHDSTSFIGTIWHENRGNINEASIGCENEGTHNQPTNKETASRYPIEKF